MSAVRSPIRAAGVATLVAIAATAVPVMATADLGPPLPPEGFTPGHGDLVLGPCDLGRGGPTDARAGVYWYCGSLPVDDVGSVRDVTFVIASSHPEVPFPGGQDVLVYQPGGPGAFVVESMLAQLPPLPVSRWSIMTWDGATSANGMGPCGGATSTFGDDRQPDELDELANAVAEECLTTGGNSGRGAWTAAWELEQIRSALGVEQVDMLVQSYGAAIVEAYMLGYPGHVRRAVLDGPVVMEVPWEDRLASVGPVQTELVAAMLDSCTQRVCGPELMDLVPAGYGAVRAAILERVPAVGAGDASLSSTQVDQAALGALRSEADWSDYLEALRAALAGDG